VSTTKIIDLSTLKAILKTSKSSRGIVRKASAQAQEQHCNRDHRYNGWENYETWNVALWLGNDEGSESYWNEAAQEAYDQSSAEKSFTREENAALWLRHKLKEEITSSADDMLEAAGQSASMLSDLLGAALSEVNWHAIAEHYIENVDKDETETADAPETE